MYPTFKHFVLRLQGNSKRKFVLYYYSTNETRVTFIFDSNSKKSKRVIFHFLLIMNKTMSFTSFMHSTTTLPGDSSKRYKANDDKKDNDPEQATSFLTLANRVHRVNKSMNDIPPDLTAQDMIPYMDSRSAANFGVTNRMNHTLVNDDCDRKSEKCPVLWIARDEYASMTRCASKCRKYMKPWLLRLIETHLDMSSSSHHAYITLENFIEPSYALAFNVTDRSAYILLMDDNSPIEIEDSKDTRFTSEQVAEIISETYQSSPASPWKLSFVWEYTLMSVPSSMIFLDIHNRITITKGITYIGGNRIDVTLNLRSLDGQSIAPEDPITYIPVDIESTFSTEFPLSVLKEVLPRLGMEHYMDGVPELQDVDIHAVD